MILEQGLIKDGLIKIYKKSNQDRTQSNDKPGYWNKNKHTMKNCAIDTWHVNIVGTTSNAPYQQQPPYQQSDNHQNYQQNPQQHYQHNTSIPHFQGPINQTNPINITTRQKPIPQTI